MIQNDDEKKYEDVIQKLKNLSRVDAPDYFEADLKRRINAEEISDKKSFRDKLILPSRLIPSAGLAVAAVVIFFVVNINSEEMDNPFLIEPKIRQDIIEVDNVEGFYDKDEKKNEIRSFEKPVEKLDGRKRKQELLGEEKAGRDEPMMMMKEQESADDRLIAESEATEPESTLTELTETKPEEIGAVESAAGLGITKQELNFRQVQLDEQEQNEVNELRNKMQINQRKRTDYQK